jgi:hypothetical protein
MTEEDYQHRMRESCDCQTCKDGKALARELSMSQDALAALRAELAQCRAALRIMTDAACQFDQQAIDGERLVSSETAADSGTGENIKDNPKSWIAWKREAEHTQQQLAQVTAERDAFIMGGVTEELLRKQDGYIKVGRGCALVVDGERDRLVKELAQCRAALNLCIDAWKHEGEPSAMGYEIAIDKAQQALRKGQP